MTIDIDAIRQRATAATEGPWVTGERRCTDEVDDWEIPVHMDGSKVDLAVVGYQTGGFHFPHADAKADAEFIAAARTDVPALCDEIERFRPVTYGDDDQAFMHSCMNLQWWNEGTRGPINEQGCDACESAPDGGWRPVYVREVAD